MRTIRMENVVSFAQAIPNILLESEAIMAGNGLSARVVLVGLATTVLATGLYFIWAGGASGDGGCVGLQGREYTVYFGWTGGLSSFRLIDQRTASEEQDPQLKALALNQAKAIVPEILRRANINDGRGSFRLAMRGCEPHLVQWTDAKLPEVSEFISSAGFWDLQNVRRILAGGMSVNARDLMTGQTALMAVVVDPNTAPRDVLRNLTFKPDPQTLDFLLQAGANPNIAREDGTTALMLAAWHGRYDAVKRLLRAGADPNAKSEQGETAAGIALARGHHRVTDLLKTPTKK